MRFFLTLSQGGVFGGRKLGGMRSVSKNHVDQNIQVVDWKKIKNPYPWDSHYQDRCAWYIGSYQMG